MIPVLCFLLGAAACLLVQTLRRGKWKTMAAPVPPAAVHWERTEGDLGYAALRHLRRDYPTHEMMTNIAMLELARPRGARADAVVQAVADWRVAAAMVNKQTGAVDRIILLAGDANLEEKLTILRRIGMRTAVLDPCAGREEITALLAA